jgi:LytS/YehU family sensor histidine kinase
VVALQKEINYISNYIALQKTRLGDTVIINYHVQGNTSGKQIAPLILISFIENAFKHGVNPDKNSKIEISIIIIENNLRLYVFNRKTNSRNEEQGIGLKNSKERLNLLYASKHELVIDNKDDTYSVHLLITLQ